MARPVVPHPGFNTRPLADRCTNHAPGVNVPATKVYSYRHYCPSCAASFAAFSRDRFGGDETRADSIRLQSEGVETVRGWVP